MVSVVINFIKGMILGIANVIPGVSAGTMALIMGIYEKLIDSISQLTKIKELKKSTVVFLGVIALGAGCGILAFANVMEFLLSDTFSKQLTYFVIIGLVIGSIPIIIKLHNDMKPTFSRILALIITTVLAVLLGSIAGNKETVESTNVTPILFGIFGYNGFDLGYGLWLLLCGFLASGAMVLPGISGSALMISLGEYGNILNVVSNRLLVQALFFGTGVILGILVFTKIIAYFIRKHTSITYYVVIGLMLSSIYQSLAQMEFKFETSPTAIISSAILLLIGIAGAYYLSTLDMKDKNAG
ncbi:MAG TPA: DUF368 domain-containing protein [Pseudobacteroides sp.]|nr:DUF368 domain-containing protein [Pseudobacteroides sp.]